MIEHAAIKKILYTHKPTAVFKQATRHGLTYTATFPGYFINFAIPFNDIEEGIFTPDMPAQHLIRWISWGIESE